MDNQLARTDKFELFNQFLALCVLTIVVGVFLTACGQPGSVHGAPESSQSKPTAPAPAVMKTQTELVTQAETKTIKNMKKTLDVSDTNQVDVIVVIDNSASMRFVQANMAQRFSSLLDELKGLDWTLGIVTTDVSSDAPKKDGRLLEMSGMPGVDHLTSAMNEEEVRKAFAHTIQRPAREGSPDEQGIKATYRALERKPDWLRANAALNVVVVTDSDETPHRGHAEIRNNPSELLKYVKSNYLSKDFFFHSIIVKVGDAECLKKDDHEAYGRTYAWLSKKTGGIIGDVCQKDYSDQLKMIGQKVSQQIRQFTLDCEPVAGSVKIHNGSEEILAFVVQGQLVKLQNSLPAGQTDVDYQCYVK
jgi:hypothetical protein